MQNSDLCVIFSNALDNAIEACDKILDDSKDKYISVNVTYINSFCFIKIENSKINEINIKNNNFITNKKDKFMHGIGLKNIKDTVYKYNGEIKIEFDDDKFVIKFIFSLKNWPVMLIWYPVTHSVLNIKLKKCKFKL